MSIMSERLKQLRLDEDLKQSDLGKLLEVSSSTIGMYEQGRRYPDFDTLIKISNYFDVSTDYLLGKTNKRKEQNTSDNNLKKMKAILKELRTEKGVSQKEVAKSLNTTDVTIGRYENGDREPKGEMLYSLAKYYDVSVDYILGYSDKRKPLTNLSDKHKKAIELAEQLTDEQFYNVINLINSMKKE